jgi:hypothetical protein
LVWLGAVRLGKVGRGCATSARSQAGERGEGNLHEVWFGVVWLGPVGLGKVGRGEDASSGAQQAAPLRAQEVGATLGSPFGGAGWVR